MLPNCPFYICKLVTGSNNLQHAAPNTTFLTAKQAAGKLTKKIHIYIVLPKNT